MTLIVGKECVMRLMQCVGSVRLGLISAAGLLMMSVAAADDARVLNLDSPRRVAGKYIVVFKSEAELRRIPTSGEGAPAVAPEIRPSSREDIRILAEALTEHASGKLGHVFGRALKAFVIEDVTDEKLLVLAKDPRIDYIEAVVSTTLSEIQGSAGAGALAP